MNAADLWTNNQPVIVLTAEARTCRSPPAGNRAFGVVDAELQYSILLNRLPGYLQQSACRFIPGVTDKFHLDLYAASGID